MESRDDKPKCFVWKYTNIKQGYKDREGETRCSPGVSGKISTSSACATARPVRRVKVRLEF